MARLTHEQVVSGLVARGVPPQVAEGVAMNFRDESGFDTGIQEQAPTAGRGGFGLAQWTGPRRVALEKFAASRNAPIDDPNVQLDFFMAENVGPEREAWSKVVNSASPQEAAVNFVQHWERPAAQHAQARSAKYSGVGGAGVAPAGDPARSVGGAGVVPASTPPLGGEATPAAAPIAPSELDKPNWMELIAKNVKGMGGGQLPGVQMSRAVHPAASIVDAPQPQAPVMPVGGIDPARREQLAMIMQRLNQGTLF